MRWKSTGCLPVNRERLHGISTWARGFSILRFLYLCYLPPTKITSSSSSKWALIWYSHLHPKNILHHLIGHKCNRNGWHNLNKGASHIINISNRPANIYYGIFTFAGSALFKDILNSIQRILILIGTPPFRIKQKGSIQFGRRWSIASIPLLPNITPFKMWAKYHNVETFNLKGQDTIWQI